MDLRRVDLGSAMGFLKVKKFRRARKPTSDNDSDDKSVPHPEEHTRINSINILNNYDKKSIGIAEEEEDNEDDDYISNEVQRRFHELRRNSFMSLIPEENGNEVEEDVEDEEHHINLNDERGIEVPNYQLFWCDFATFYRSYCERMLLFDKMSVQLLKDAGEYIYTLQMLCYTILFICYAY